MVCVRGVLIKYLNRLMDTWCTNKKEKSVLFNLGIKDKEISIPIGIFVKI